MAKEGKDIHNAHTIKVFKNWGRGGVRERKKNTKQKNVTFKIIKPSDTTRKKVNTLK